jgi:hypothetical protein
MAVVAAQAIGGRLPTKGDERLTDHRGTDSAPQIKPGDHICALVAGRTQRDAILRPFLNEGLSAGHKCLLGLAEPDPWQAVSKFLPTLDPERLRSAGQLTVLGTGDPQFSPDYFSLPAMLTFWADVTNEAKDRGYEFARLTAEARWWSPQLPDSDALIDYEVALNAFADKRAVAILCVYDLEDYGWMLTDLVKTHPRVLINDVEFANPYFTPPEQVRESRR